MAVTSHVYPKAMNAIVTGTWNLTTGPFKALLCANSAVTWGATQEAYQFVSDATANYGGEAAGYTRPTLASPALTVYSGNLVKWTVTSPISFGTTVTVNAASMFVYTTQVGTVDASFPLICVIDFGQTVSSTAGSYTYTLDATNGLAYFTQN